MFLLVIATGSSLLYCRMDDFSKVNETTIKVLSLHPSGHVEVRCPRGKKKYIFSDQKHCFDTVTPWQAVRTSLICGTFAVTVWRFTESRGFRSLLHSRFLGEFARRLASNRGKDQEEWIADTIARADDNTHVTPAIQKNFLGSLSGS